MTEEQYETRRAEIMEHYNNARDLGLSDVRKACVEALRELDHQYASHK